MLIDLLRSLIRGTAKRGRPPQEAANALVDPAPELQAHIQAQCDLIRELAMQGQGQRADQAFAEIAHLRTQSSMVALCEINLLWFSGSKQQAFETGQESMTRFSADPGLVAQWIHFAQALGRHADLIRASLSFPAVCAGNASIQRALGDSHLALGAELDAARCYEQAVASNPGDVLALHNLGFVCAALGLIDQAEPALRRAIELDPGMAEAYNNLSIVLQKRKDFPAAIASISHAVSLDGDNVRYLAQLASLLMYTCAWDELAEIKPRLLRLVEREIAEQGTTGLPPLLAISLGASPELQKSIAMAYFRSRVPLG